METIDRAAKGIELENETADKIKDVHVFKRMTTDIEEQLKKAKEIAIKATVEESFNEILWCINEFKNDKETMEKYIKGKLEELIRLSNDIRKI